jgi:hypothetical protein
MQAFIYLALFFIGLFSLLMIFQWIRDYINLRNRRGDKKEDFIDYFVSQGISESLALSVYHYLQNWVNFKDFPVRPQDNIDDIYGIAEESLDDLIIEIAESNNLEIPSNTDYWGKPVVTVEDLIRFIASFPIKRI